jgi:hypothetical protein
MENRSATITVDAKLANAYNAAPKTVQKKVQSVLRQTLREADLPTTSSPRLSKAETALFLRINRVLPLAQQQRYEELKGKLEVETLTPTEHAELLQLVEDHQQLWADRLQAVIDLAALRGIAPSAMFKQLGINPSRYA